MHDEDDRPRKGVTHEIGQKLDALSIDDLAERIALLHLEIDRLEAEKSAKQAALTAAGALFKS